MKVIMVYLSLALINYHNGMINAQSITVDSKYKSATFVLLGDHLRVRCVYEDDNFVLSYKPILKWSSLHKPFNTRERIQVTAYGDLLLEKAALSDTDRYKCVVRGFNMDSDKQQETVQRFYHYIIVYKQPLYQLGIELSYVIDKCTKWKPPKRFKYLKRHLCGKRPQDCPFHVTYRCLWRKDVSTSLLEFDIVLKPERNFSVESCRPMPSCARDAYTEHLYKGFRRLESLVKNEIAAQQKPGEIELGAVSVQERCSAGYVHSFGRCLPCMPGTFSYLGALECTPCPFAMYQQEFAMPWCTNCPPGSNTFRQSATSAAECHVPRTRKFLNATFTLLKREFGPVKRNWLYYSGFYILVSAIMVFVTWCFIRFESTLKRMIFRNDNSRTTLGSMEEQSLLDMPSFEPTEEDDDLVDDRKVEFHDSLDVRKDSNQSSNTYLVSEQPIGSENVSANARTSGTRGYYMDTSNRARMMTSDADTRHLPTKPASRKYANAAGYTSESDTGSTVTSLMDDATTNKTTDDDVDDEDESTSSTLTEFDPLIQTHDVKLAPASHPYKHVHGSNKSDNRTNTPYTGNIQNNRNASINNHQADIGHYGSTSHPIGDITSMKAQTNDNDTQTTNVTSASASKGNVKDAVHWYKQRHVTSARSEPIANGRSQSAASVHKMVDTLPVSSEAARQVHEHIA